MAAQRLALACFAALVAAAAAKRELHTFSMSGGSFGSSVTCSAQASATAVEAAKNAYVSACADAIAVGCASDFSGQISDIERKFSQDWAGAFAAAITAAQAKCVSSGNAFGCAGAAAVAQAYAEATAEAHAQAVASALDQSGCTSSSAAAFGAADTYIQLVAEACSAVDAAVCVVGDQAASASSYQTCLGIVVAKVFAKAVAKALVDGGCMSTSAAASIKAQTGATYKIAQGCAASQQASGPAGSTSTGASGSGSADAFPGLPPLFGR